MPRPDYPAAERLDIVDDLHGRAVPDPYRWLEDADDPRTTAWETEQDALVEAARADWPSRETFRSRLESLYASGSVSVPVWRGDRQFLLRRTPDQEHAVLLLVEADGSERVLVDPMAIDPNGTTTLDSWQPSKEGDRLAYLLSESGTEESVLRVMDVASGELVDGPIDRGKYTPVAWLPGGEAYYYIRRLAPELVPADESQYHRRIWLHRVGSSPDTDVMVFGEEQPKTNYHEVSVSRDGRWLEIWTGTGTAPRNDLWLADLTASPLEKPELQPVQIGVDAKASTSIGRAGTAFAERVYIETDRDAPRGRICVASTSDFSYEAWQDLIPEDPEAVLGSYAVLDGAELDRPLLLVSWVRHAISEISVHDLETGAKVGSVPLPGLGTLTGLTARSEGGHEAWFSYVDYTTPSQVYRYDAVTGETTLWASAPGDVEIPAVRSRQVTYTSKDGTTIRMFVIDDGTNGPIDGPATEPRPAVLYGYGGFNIAMTPGYDPRILSWVETGGVWAVANLRGGSEEGEAWHRDGMMANKQNVFDDFHAAGDWLVEQGLTTRGQLGVFGGSNGGLLVGVALTQHPEKYEAVLCWAPLLDMVRYEKFGLGVTWNEEYGTADDPEQLGWLLGYSPYHNVREVTSDTSYPATLFTVFDGDTRVDPLHARKLAAALQHATSGDRPILYRIERDAGHGPRSVSRSVGVFADMMGFLAARLGLSKV